MLAGPNAIKASGTDAAEATDYEEEHEYELTHIIVSWASIHSLYAWPNGYGRLSPPVKI